jgi:predicted exporter
LLSLNRSIRLGLWIALAVALGLGVSFIRVDADLSRFVSAGQPSWQLDLGVALQRGAGRLVLISVMAPTPQESASASRKMVSALRASSLFATLHNGDASLLAAEVEPLVPYRYILSDRVDAATFSESSLRSSLRQAQAMLADSRSWVVAQLLPIDPTLETLHLVEQWSGGARLPLRHGVWFTKSGSAALIVGTTRAAGDDAEAQREVDVAIRQAAATSGAGARSHPVQVTHTGLGLLAAEARHATRSRVEWLAWVSGAFVTIILYLGYRRLLPVALSLLPVAFGIATGLVATQWAFGDVNILAVAFACILIDEGSDYPSYLLTQSRPGRTLGSEAARIWPTLRLAVLTSTAAFAVLLLAQFRGLQQLGLLCGVGLLVAGAAARWLVPDLYNPQRTATWSPPGVARAAPVWLGGGRFQVEPWSRFTSFAVPLSALLVLAVAKPLWDDGIASINPLSPELIATDRELRREAGLPLDQSVLLFVGEPQSVLQAQEAWLPALLALQKQGSVDTFDLAAKYLPSNKTQQQRLSAVPDESALRSLLERASQGTDFNVEAFQPFFESVQQTRSSQLSLDRLPAGMFRERLQSLLVNLDGKTVGVVPISGSATRNELLASARQAVAGQSVAVDWFEPRVELSALLSAVRERLIWLMLFCVATISVVVALEKRSVALGWRVMQPVIVSILLTAAVVRVAFGPLTVFNIVALMLVLGVITNYSLFLHSTPHTDDGNEGKAHTVFSLMIASATTIAVFGVLGFSGIGVVEAVGRTVVVGIIVGLAWLCTYRICREQGRG